MVLKRIQYGGAWREKVEKRGMWWEEEVSEEGKRDEKDDRVRESREQSEYGKAEEVRERR